MELLEKEKCKISVSSVLDRNGKEYGKQFLLDGEEDTCWNSDQGIPQYIRVTLNDKQKCTKLMLKVQFQGGFCGKESEICFKNGSDEVLNHNFYPKDDNDYQEFMIESQEIEFDNFQITFKSTTDFYGRIIIYQLSLLQL